MKKPQFENKPTLAVGLIVGIDRCDKKDEQCAIINLYYDNVDHIIYETHDKKEIEVLDKLSISANNIDKPSITVINDVISTITSLAHKEGSNTLYIADIDQFIDQLKRKYGLIPNYPTLREYIKENENGAYHHFIFKIMGVPVEIDGIFEFELVFKSNLLDEYVVINDRRNDNGAGCDQYVCNHYLDIEEKEVNKVENR